MILLQRNGAARGAAIGELPGCSATLDDAPDAQCCSSLDTVVLLLSRRLSVVLAGFRRQLDIYPRGAVNLVHALSDDGRRQVGVLLSALSAGLAGRRANGCKLVTRVVDGRVQGAMVTCAALFRTASYRGGFSTGTTESGSCGHGRGCWNTSSAGADAPVLSGSKRAAERLFHGRELEIRGLRGFKGFQFTWGSPS
ncbi:hypothetical protein pipiens_009993 [Culex pipiens pipiens]|uniref:Uncharacterized protein n=1 Tax=Culex pipiens pipiens TaxID=38569 RepID=A0ABD1DBX6_CULPP